MAEGVASVSVVGGAFFALHSTSYKVLAAYDNRQTSHSHSASCQRASSI